jgi:hypothetical protein
MVLELLAGHGSHVRLPSDKMIAKFRGAQDETKNTGSMTDKSYGGSQVAAQYQSSVSIV